MVTRIRIAAETPWYDLFSRGARDWLRHNEKVREAVRENLLDLISGHDLMSHPTERKVRVPLRLLEHARFRLAQLAQNEIVARTDLLDCRIHSKTWQLLRMTRMPAVRIDVGYVTNARDAARLGTAEFRDAVAEAVVAAVQRLYLPPDRDIATGQFRMPALAR